MNRPGVGPAEIGHLVALVNQDRLSDAELAARKLLNRWPQEGMLWKILSVALVRQGKDALPALRRSAELLPGDAEAHRNLGAALHDRAQWAPALQSLSQALSIQPDDVEALVDAANALRALGRATEAPPLYQRAIQLNPRSTEAYNNLGNAYLELTEYPNAALCFQAALRLRPNDALILCNLGNALRQLGKLEDAVAATRRALAFDPALTVAHNNLGLMLTALGRRDEAAACFQQAIALDPTHGVAMANLGNVLRDSGQRREALVVYRRAIEIDRANAEYWWSLGSVQFEQRQMAEAMESFASALKLQPNFAPAHLSMGLALRQQRRPAEAESSCRAALAIEPGYVEALVFLGELCADRGDFREAETLFQQALAINPEFPFAYFSIATHRRMTTADGAWLEGAKGMLAASLPLGQEINLNYALGKYFDDVEEYDQAFDHYRTANELTKRFGSAYNRRKFTEMVDQIIHSFDQTFIRLYSDRASTSEVPVFIVGMPRSGTSLTEQILASHPSVFGAGEVPFWESASAAYRKSKVDRTSGDKFMAKITADYIEKLTAPAAGEVRVVDKMPANFLHAGLIHAAFPRARIIHMRRDPIDTCLSIYFQNFFGMGPYANDLDDLAHYYTEYTRITNHWRALLPATTWLEVPYEQLIADQEHWTRRLLEFIGLPWEPKCLQFERTDRVVITASKWQVRQKIHSGSVARWRHYENYIGPLRHLTEQPLEK